VAIALVTHRLSKSNRKQKREFLAKIGERCVLEYLDEKCSPCKGRGNVVPEGSPVATQVCTVCAGTGRKRHADHERARAIGVSIDSYAKLERLFSAAHGFIGTADVQAGKDVALQLRNVNPQG
jgi:hypothetical protein